MAESPPSDGGVAGASAAVRKFFRRVLLASLELPDGSFDPGRAGETLHRLTFSAVRPYRLLIELDGQILLSFSGAPACTSEKDVLQLEGYDQLVVDGRAMGT